MNVFGVLQTTVIIHLFSRQCRTTASAEIMSFLAYSNHHAQQHDNLLGRHLTTPSQTRQSPWPTSYHAQQNTSISLADISPRPAQQDNLLCPTSQRSANLRVILIYMHMYIPKSSLRMFINTIPFIKLLC